MNEEKQAGKEEAKAQTPANSAANTPDGYKLEVPGFVRQAFEAREGVARENERLERNIKELKELRQWDVLGGTTTSGQPAMKKEESPVEYAKKVLSGQLK